MRKIDKKIIHASSVAWRMPDDSILSILLRAKAGGGKSDLSFRLIEDLGALLIADDQVVLENRNGNIITSCEESIKGLLELRGVGLLKYSAVNYAKLALVVDLVNIDKMPRMPEWKKEKILDVSIARLELNAFEASSAHKIYKAIQVIYNPDILVEGNY